jgi:hypothetical protein
MCSIECWGCKGIYRMVNMTQKFKNSKEEEKFDSTTGITYEEIIHGSECYYSKPHWEANNTIVVKNKFWVEVNLL